MLATGFTQLDLSTTAGVSANQDTVPFSARYELAHRVSPQLRLNVGLDAFFGYSHQALDPQTSARGSQGGMSVALDNSGAFVQPAAYVEAEVTPVSRLRIVPAVRVDYIDAIARAIVSPRVSMRWEFVPGWAVRGGVGLFTQPPTFQQSSTAPNLLFPGQTLGNPHLLPQRATHYSLAAEHDFSRYLSLSVEGFYKNLDDLVVGTSTIARLQNPPAPPYLNTGAGRVYGLEVLLRHRANDRFFGWLAYTLMRAERQDAPGQPWHLFQYDQTHILTAIASVVLGDGWEIGARFRYVTGTPVTPVIGSFYNADTTSYVPIYAPPNSARAADFHQLDLRVDKGFRIGSFRLGVYLEVLNVYNQSNQEGVQYNFDYTQRQPINGIPFFPNLGLRGEL
jgi:outer membrane receptor protein involved in Fe transport